MGISVVFIIFSGKKKCKRWRATGAENNDNKFRQVENEFCTIFSSRTYTVDSR